AWSPSSACWTSGTAAFSSSRSAWTTWPRASMLRADGLRHAFGRVRALDDISFLLTPGQTLAIFGPNGAGKTTLLKVLAGLIRPQGGTTHVEGGPRAVGWIGDHAQLYGHLTVRENLLFWAALYDVPAPLRRARVDEGLRRQGLADRAAEFRRLLAQLAGAGRIVVLATHNVGEGVELATDIAFQQRGRFVSLGPRGARTAGAVVEEYRRAVGGG